MRPKNFVSRALVVLPAAITVGMLLLGNPLGADDAVEEVPVARPILIFQVAAVDRLLDRINDLFSDIDRPDMSEQIQKGLDVARNLEGLDRSRPMGIALFLPDSLPPRPTPVAFVPVGDIDELLKTMDLGPMKARKKEGAPEGHFELVGSRRTMQLVVRGGYAFVSPEESLLDSDLEAVAAQAKLVSEKYNLCLTVRPQNIPVILRDVFLGFLRTQTEAELQRRDDEPRSQYLARRANGVSQLEFLDRLLRETERLTIGIATAEDRKGAVIELDLQATADSAFAKYLKDIAGRPTAYASVFDAEQPFTLSASWFMEEREQTAALDWLEAFEAGFSERMTPSEAAPVDAAVEKTDAKPPRRPALERLIGPLEATIKAGHFDLALQMRPVDTNRFALVGALGLIGGRTFATGLRETLTALQADPAFQVDLDVGTHDDIVFHRLAGLEAREQDLRTYGEQPGVYLGASSRTFWFAMGGEGALSELKGVVDLVRETGDGVAPAATPATTPFQLVIRPDQWKRLPDPEDEEEALDAELARDAFTSANDMLRIVLRPTDSGIRLRVEMGHGFLRMLALSLARQYDESRL